MGLGRKGLLKAWPAEVALQHRRQEGSPHWPAGQQPSLFAPTALQPSPHGCSSPYNPTHTRTSLGAPVTHHSEGVQVDHPRTISERRQYPEHFPMLASQRHPEK